MLSEYRGPANSREVFQYLVGEKLTAVFQIPGGERGPNTYFVAESGPALVMNSTGAFWVESAKDVAQVVECRRKDIEQRIAELKDMPGVPLPPRGPESRGPVSEGMKGDNG